MTLVRQLVPLPRVQDSQLQILPLVREALPTVPICSQNHVILSILISPITMGKQPQQANNT